MGGAPSKAAFEEAYYSASGQQVIKDKVTLLHCTTEYPAPINDINLNAMNTMHNAFHTRVGYSDHSEGVIVPVAAVAMGASIIEKHFTLDKTLSGPDHAASLEPVELKSMIDSIRTVDKVKGSGVKGPSTSELGNRNIARKSLVAAVGIKQGEEFTENNITSKRPGTGKSPMEYWDILGHKVSEDYLTDELIK